MVGENVADQLADHRSKKNGKRREGKEKGDSDRRGDGGAPERDLAADIPEDGEENRSSEHAECDTKMKKRKDEEADVKKDKKMKKEKRRKEKEAETTVKEQVLDSTGENVSVDKGEDEHGTKPKKGKRKREDGEPAADGSAGNQTVTTKDKKKRRKERSVTLEADNHVEISKMEKKIDGKKKRIKESDKSNPDLSHNASTGGKEAGGDGKNDKKKKKIKEGNGGQKNEKEKASRSKDKGRRVSFADSVEVFSVDGGDGKEGGRSGESKVVHAERFTPEENATLMEAIKNYVEMKQLGEKGLDMIRACSKHPELKGCWAEIAKSLPHRPSIAIYRRARVLLNQSAERKWTPEDYEKVRRYVEKNGTHWKPLAQELGRSEIHVKDAWRRIKPKKLKKGHWTQDEYQNMFDLVNLDLRVKAQQEIDTGHRHIRENISWEAISEKLATRNHKNCCLRWYQLRSLLVKEGVWETTDDYRLLEVLENVDAVCVEDVDWENLLDNRSGEVCRQRWNEMVRSIGGHKEKPFIEQVEVLSKRYCPEMLDYGKQE